MAQSYEVIIEYCDGHSFNHGHRTMRSAAKEYVDQMAEILEPKNPDPVKHVRMLSLMILGDGGVSRRINTGVIPCSHRGVS